MTVQDIRSFNRFYTNVIGALDYGRHLYAPYTLTESRVLYELAHSPLHRRRRPPRRTVPACWLPEPHPEQVRAGRPDRADPLGAGPAAAPHHAHGTGRGDRRPCWTSAHGNRWGRCWRPCRPTTAPGSPRRCGPCARCSPPGAHHAARTSSCAIPGPATSAGSCSATPRCTPPSTAGTPTTRAWSPGSWRTSPRTTIRTWSGCGSPSWTAGRWAA